MLQICNFSVFCKLNYTIEIFPKSYMLMGSFIYTTKKLLSL